MVMRTRFSLPKRAAASSDHFTFVFDEPVKAKSIAVVTGRTDGSDALDEGKLEVSSDAKTFHELAQFADGKAKATPGDEAIKAVRIQPAANIKHALAIRELTIESDPPVAKFSYPVEFNIDVADEPKMKDWAENAAKICAREYPMINEQLKSDGYKPPTVVTLAMKSDYRGVAFASGSRITGSVKYFQDHPNDVGAMVHETVHVVQHYNGRGNPGWLVEGVSDYIRFFKFEPGKIGRINPERAHYNGSYRVTAAFLAYITDKYDKQARSETQQGDARGPLQEGDIPGADRQGARRPRQGVAGDAEAVGATLLSVGVSHQSFHATPQRGRSRFQSQDWVGGDGTGFPGRASRRSRSR